MRPLRDARRLAGRVKRALFPRPEVAAWRHACAQAETTERYTPGTIELMGYRLRYVDLLTLCPQWDEIFVRDVYRFDTAERAPRILDCGANVGLASLSFKRRYPQARVTAFEADPDIHAALAANLAAAAADVEAVHAAVWTEAGELEFRCEGADSGTAASLSRSTRGVVKSVPAVRLRDWLIREPVDLLKLDVEGAESALLADCADALHNVRHMIVEIHEPHATRRLPGLLAGLAAAGFSYTLDELQPLPWLDDSPPPGFPKAARSFVLLARAWREAAP